MTLTVIVISQPNKVNQYMSKKNGNLSILSLSNNWVIQIQPCKLNSTENGMKFGVNY